MFTADVPSGWSTFIVRIVKVALVAFIVLQTKEWVDAGRFDTPGTAADAGMIAGGVLVLDLILKFAKSK